MNDCVALCMAGDDMTAEIASWALAFIFGFLAAGVFGRE